MKRVPLSAHRHLQSFALSLLLMASATRCVAAELPDAPVPQTTGQSAPAAPAAPATLVGTITDTDGDSIPGATVSLTANGQPPIQTTTADDGTFSFLNLPAGAFTLSVVAGGFASQHQLGTLQPGESREIPVIVMGAATVATVNVMATQADIAEAQINDEEKQRVLGVIPNFYVSYSKDPVPLDAKQKYELALKTLIDPATLVINGVAAGVQQASDDYAWGGGSHAYAKRYAAAYGTLMTGTILGGAVLPVLFKQDPRYFYKGTGSIPSRAGYAIANAVVCKGDNMHWQFNISGILGGLMASGLSNAYYPAVNRAGADLTFEGAAIGTGAAAVYNLFQEFVVHRLTPHVARQQPINP